MAKAKDNTTLVWSVKPGVNFPRNTADVVKIALLEADKDTVADWLENLPNESFLSTFTPENRKLLAKLLKGEIKKRRGLKQERGFDDCMIWFHYKRLRADGHKSTQAIKKTAKDLMAARTLPTGDLLRHASEGRYWKEENIEENVKEIVSKVNKFFELTRARIP